MTPAAPAVALLFDDVELGVHLREALNERGARIVHEGGLSSLTRELLETGGASVLVVNLDESVDDALDHLYAVIDGASQRVVFNDAQASRGLTGWDRARWARHLVLKVFEVGELDPPRPEHARGLELPEQAALLDAAPDAAESGAAPSHTDSASVAVDGAEMPVANTYIATATDKEFLGAAAPDLDLDTVTETDPISAAITGDDAWALADAADASAVAVPVATIEDAPYAPAEDADAALLDMSEMASFDSVPLVLSEAESYQGEAAGDASESLAAELEALLASGELTVDEDEMTAGTGLRFSNDDEAPALHDGHFGPPPAAPADASEEPDFLETQVAPPADTTPQRSAVTAATFELDHLALTPMQDAVPSSFDAPVAASAGASATAAPAPVSAPVGWSLMEEDAAPGLPSTKPSPAEFGIEKMSAADFLAPEVENAEAYSEPVMSLRLLSMEEAIAPRQYEAPSEIGFDDVGSALKQVILLGASASGADAVGDFLAALPADNGLFFMHTQHFGDTPVNAMVAKLASRSTVPVRLATQGAHAGRGEVLVVPPGQQMLLLRDGSVGLQPSDMHASKEPSIDASFTMAAGVFTQDALAIVFAGRGNDAVAGSQAVHDRGGKVWVESSSGAHLADMVSGIVAERLVSFSGSPHELAAHLIEVYR